MNPIIHTEVDSRGLGRLRMQDSGRRNVLADDFIQAFLAGLDELAGKQAKVLILSGLPDVFCTGADKKNLLALCAGEIHVKDLALSDRLLDAPFPVIAAMEGHALGGGLMLAACADMAVAARESRYGAVFMNLGFTPGMGCTRLLAELMGPFLANEMMYTGKCYKGAELAGLGARMNGMVPKAEVMARAEDLAGRICEKEGKALRLLKPALAAPKKQLLLQARSQEDLMHQISFAFPETRRAVAAMVQEPAEIEKGNPSC